MKKLNIEEFCPEHFMQKIDGRQYGTVENVEYFSAACNKTRPANVLLPNGYDPKVKYPVLYVLHGFFCTQFTMLQDDDSCNQKIIANLIEEKLAKPMIVVFPYIFASTIKEVCDGFSEENVNAYNNFLNDLTGDLMPFIEKKYSVKYSDGKKNLTIIDGCGNETTVKFNSYDDPVELVDSCGRKVTCDYSPAGVLRAEKNAFGGKIVYGWNDAFDKVSKISEDKTSVVDYTYDSMGRLESESFINGEKNNYEYSKTCSYNTCIRKWRTFWRKYSKKNLLFFLRL